MRDGECQSLPYSTEDKEQVGEIDCGFATVAVGENAREQGGEKRGEGGGGGDEGFGEAR